MSEVRVSVEWIFGDIINYFKFLDFKNLLGCLFALTRHLDTLCVSRTKNLVNNIPLKLTSSHSNFMTRMKYRAHLYVSSNEIDIDEMDELCAKHKRVKKAKCPLKQNTFFANYYREKINYYFSGHTFAKKNTC